MGGNPCIIKKRSCNPPIKALMNVPELLITDYMSGSGAIDRNQMDQAGFADMLYRCAEIDEWAEARYRQCLNWFYQNAVRVENLEKPLPVPWKTYEPYEPYEHSKDQSLEDAWNNLDIRTKRKLLSSLHEEDSTPRDGNEYDSEQPLT